MANQTNARLSQGPEERTKGTVVLCPCPRADLAKLVYGRIQWLTAVKFVASGDPTLPPGLWLSILRQVCLRYPVFSLTKFFNLALC